MYNRKKAFWCLPVMALVILTVGCAPQKFRTDGTANIESKNLSKKEQLLLKTNSYERLIEINRDLLKKKEDPEVRFRLAEYYYLSGNHNSSLHYLAVSLQKTPSAKVYLLQSKNLVALQKHDHALKSVELLIQSEPGNAEGLNLKGVVLAEKGDLAGALTAFEQARNAFYPEEKVLNNMALIHIAERRYQEAIQLLLPIYLRGYRDAHLTHNLIFALVKTGDLRYAKELIKRENVSSYPDRLVSSLFEIESNMAPM